MKFCLQLVSPTPHAVRYYYQLNYTIMKSKKRSRKYRWYMRHDRHSVSLLTSHTVFCTKYRMPLLTVEIANRCEQIIREIACDLNIRIIRMAVNIDHVHIFYVYPPKLSPSVIAKKFKNYSSLHLRREFPELKKKVKKHLWAPSNYHGSVGIGFEVVENYIRGQEGYNYDN